MLLTCRCTVFSLRTSSVAIDRLVLPAAISREHLDLAGAQSHGAAVDRSPTSASARMTSGRAPSTWKACRAAVSSSVAPSSSSHQATGLRDEDPHAGRLVRGLQVVPQPAGSAQGRQRLGRVGPRRGARSRARVPPGRAGRASGTARRSPRTRLAPASAAARSSPATMISTYAGSSCERVSSRPGTRYSGPSVDSASAPPDRRHRRVVSPWARRSSAMPGWTSQPYWPACR